MMSDKSDDDDQDKVPLAPLPTCLIPFCACSLLFVALLVASQGVWTTPLPEQQKAFSRHITCLQCCSCKGVGV